MKVRYFSRHAVEVLQRLGFLFGVLGRLVRVTSIIHSRL